MYNLTLLRQFLSLLTQVLVYIFLITVASTMPAEGACYIITVSGGTVVDKQSNGVFDKNAEEGSATQHWTVEHGDQPNVVAFQNASTGGWLRAFTGAAYGKVDCGEKQWWTLEKGPSPGSCWIKCNDYKDAYLCNANGSYVDKNKVYTWPKQLNWTHALTWHLKDANAPGFVPGQETPSSTTSASTGGGEAKDDGSEALQKQIEDLEAKEASFAERESKMKKDLEGKEAALAEKEKEFEELRRELETKQNTAENSNSGDLQKKIKDLEAKGASFAKKESKVKDLEGREAALVEKEKKVEELQKKEQEMKRREEEVAANEAKQKKREDQLAASEKELAERPAPSNTEDVSSEQQDLQKKLEELRKTEQEVAAREASAAKRDEVAAAKAKEMKAREAELEKKLRDAGDARVTAVKLENDNLKLQLRLKEMERELEAAKKKGPAGTGDAHDAAKCERLENENQRLKNLIAQRFLSEQGTGQAGKVPGTSTNGGASGPNSTLVSKAKTSGSATGKTDEQPSTNEQAVNRTSKPSSNKPSANMSRPVSKTSGSRTGSTAATNGGNTDLNSDGAASQEPAKTSAKGSTIKAVSKGSEGAKSVATKTPHPKKDTDATQQDAARESSATSKPKPTENATGRWNSEDSKKLGGPQQGRAPNPSTATPNGTSNGASSVRQDAKPATTNGTKTPSKRGSESGSKPSAGEAAQDKDASASKPSKTPSSAGPKSKSPGTKPSASKTLSTPGDKITGNDHAGHKHTQAGHQHPKRIPSGAGSSQVPQRIDSGDCDDDSAMHFSCGHVVHPPPRKLNRKALGILYE